MADNKKGLGRGLSALLGEDKELSSAISGTEVPQKLDVSEGSTSIREVNLSDLEVSPLQPRVTFDEDSLRGMVESIKEKGILQPLLVRAKQDGKFEIIAGERRFRGATEAGIEKVPVIIRDFTDKEVLEVALIENIQRENLNAIEEAYGYKKLMEEFNHTQEELAKIVGKSRSHVANTLRLTSLSTELKDLVVNGDLSAGHARALLTAKEPEKLAKKVISKNLSVRQTEKLASETDEDSSKKIEKSVKKMAKETSYQKDDDIVALEQELENKTGLKVTINFDGKGGELILFYDNLEQLDSVVQKLYTDNEAPTEMIDENGEYIEEQQSSEDFDEAMNEMVTETSPETEIIEDSEISPEESEEAVVMLENEDMINTPIITDEELSEEGAEITDEMPAAEIEEGMDDMAAAMIEEQVSVDENEDDMAAAMAQENQQ